MQSVVGGTTRFALAAGPRAEKQNDAKQSETDAKQSNAKQSDATQSDAKQSEVREVGGGRWEVSDGEHA